MNLDIHISSTNLLTQKQQQELTELTTFCCHHDCVDLSYPIEEEHLTHILGYLADGRLAACLTLIPYEEALAECCAFTHPEFRRQGLFSRLLDEALAQYPDVDLLFAVSEGCKDAIKTLEALGAEKDSEEHMMERSLEDLSDCPHAKDFSSPFSIRQLSDTEYALDRSGIRCGTASAEPVSQTTVCLHHVEILPEFRNQGCGTVFLHLMLPKLFKNGFRKVILQVAGDNVPAIALYKKTGFSVTKTLSYYFY